MTAKMASAFALLIFSLSIVPSIFAQENCIRPREITVNGTSEIKVPPDEVILALGVESRDKDLAVAKANNDTVVKKVLALAHSAGVEPKNIKTSALNMGPNYSEERIPKLFGYQVSQTISVTLTDVSKYENLMTESLRAGANQVYGITFRVAEPAKYKEEARLKAIRAAREKATSMAAELGEKLAKPLNVVEEGSSDFPYQGRLPANVQNSMDLATPEQGIGAEPTVAEGVVTIRATVRITFQLE
jgi:uncharacterized protein